MRHRCPSPSLAECDSPSPLRLHHFKVPLLAPGLGTRTDQAMDLHFYRGRTPSARGLRTIRRETCSSLPAQRDPILTATRSLFPARVFEHDQANMSTTADELPVIKWAASVHGKAPEDDRAGRQSSRRRFTRSLHHPSSLANVPHVCTLS